MSAVFNSYKSKNHAQNTTLSRWYCLVYIYICKNGEWMPFWPNL